VDQALDHLRPQDVPQGVDPGDFKTILEGL
jgi:hypothetical protein